MKKYSLRFVALFVILVVVAMLPTDLVAQCPMCKMAAESNLNNGGTAGKGLNMGIFYMLATPYLIVGTLAYIWFRNRKKNNEDIEYVD